MPRSFDILARPYRFLEQLCFGNLLQNARTHFIPTLSNKKLQILVLGDGDGRFSTELLAQRPLSQIDSLDISPAMLQRATRRIHTHHPDQKNNYTPIKADALHHPLPKNHYDLIVLNFFLDCFDDSQANTLIQKSIQALTPTGSLIYTDFAIPTTQPQKTIAHILIKTLYTAFHLTTGLKSKRLPNLTWPHPLQQTAHKTWAKGIITTHLYTKKDEWDIYYERPCASLI